MACNRDNRDFWVKSSDIDDVQDLGIFEPIPVEEASAAEWQLAGLDGLHYGQLGAPEDPSNRGGATFQFRGTGGKVCVVMDPETVYWSQDISKSGSGFIYQDNFRDDGDLDMSVGLSAYYNGSPGVTVGNFQLPYTDPLGEDHNVDFNECNADLKPAGRGTIEFCEINTANREGIFFTTLLKTFSVPIDDGVLSYGVAVIDSPCAPEGQPFRKTECTISYEADDGDATGPHAALEAAFCGGDINKYCADNLGGGKNALCSEGYVPAK
jgi:hypothetical protein